MNFQKEKIEFLRKKDKSEKGSLDKKIKKLVNKINSFDDLYTTSSCSGRTILLAQHGSGRKDKTKLLFTSHDKINLKKIKNRINLNNLPKNEIWFKVEPVILHVACDNIEATKKLLNLARYTGFKRSGIISIGKNKFVLELVSTERIDTIISKNKRLLIDNNYFKVLINEGNKKLEKTWEKISKLYKGLNKVK